MGGKASAVAVAMIWMSVVVVSAWASVSPSAPAGCRRCAGRAGEGAFWGKGEVPLDGAGAMAVAFPWRLAWT